MLILGPKIPSFTNFGHNEIFLSKKSFLIPLECLSLDVEQIEREVQKYWLWAQKWPTYLVFGIIRTFLKNSKQPLLPILLYLPSLLNSHLSITNCYQSPPRAFSLHFTQIEKMIIRFFFNKFRKSQMLLNFMKI